MHEHDIFNLDISRQLLDYAIKIAFGVIRWCVLIWSPYEGDGHSRTCCVNVIVLWTTVYKNWPYCTYTHFGEKPPLNQWTVWDPGFLFFGFFFFTSTCFEWLKHKLTVHVHEFHTVCIVIRFLSMTDFIFIKQYSNTHYNNSWFSRILFYEIYIR